MSKQEVVGQDPKVGEGKLAIPASNQSEDLPNANGASHGQRTQPTDPPGSEPR